MGSQGKSSKRSISPSPLSGSGPAEKGGNGDQRETQGRG
uniref:Uncharacterized protein n=1 Tax=Arundo donax TaxID=35708 RepID=A0A0A9G976_ARUDO